MIENSIRKEKEVIHGKSAKSDDGTHSGTCSREQKFKNQERPGTLRFRNRNPRLMDAPGDVNGECAVSCCKYLYYVKISKA